MHGRLCLRLSFGIYLIASTRLVLGQVDAERLRAAVHIRSTYAGLNLDIVDAMCVVLAAEFDTNAILTLDRRDSRALRPLAGFSVVARRHGRASLIGSGAASRRNGEPPVDRVLVTEPGDQCGGQIQRFHRHLPAARQCRLSGDADGHMPMGEAEFGR